MKAFLIKLTIATILSFAVCETVYYKLEGELADASALVAVIFMTLITLFSFSMVARAVNKNNRQFVTFFMGAFGGKFLFSIGFFAILLYFNKADKIPLAITFVTAYALMTIVEVGAMVKLVRNSSPKKGN